MCQLIKHLIISKLAHRGKQRQPGPRATLDKSQMEESFSHQKLKE